MKTEVAKKTAFKIATQEQHENVRNTRKTLKVLQQAASSDKENLAGRPRVEKGLKLASDVEKVVKAREVADKSCQTGESVITAEDLTSEEPSLDYWKQLAEKRGEALDESIHENEKLKEQVENLQEENRICKDMLEESRNLVDILKDMLEENEGDTSTEIAVEATET